MLCKVSISYIEEEGLESQSLYKCVRAKELSRLFVWSSVKVITTPDAFQIMISIMPQCVVLYN